MTRPVLLAVVCSTRPHRIGRAIGDWFVAVAPESGPFEVRLVDLAELALPFMDEPKHPRQHHYSHDHTRQWSRTIAGADAVVWVQPEYNFAMAAAQKNALDYLSLEWSLLPTGFVSYGGISGGLRGMEHAKQPLAAVRSVFANPNVTVPHAGGMVDDGVFTPSESVTRSVAPMLADLHALHEQLGALRREKLAPLGY